MLKAILLFPFRLIRAIFYPWYIRWIFALPWWVLAALAIWMGSYLVQAIPTAIAGNVATEIIRADGPPPLRALHEFDPRRDITDLDEANIAASYRSDAGVVLLALTGPDMIAVPLFAKGRSDVAAIAYALTNQEAELLSYLSSQGAGVRHAVEVNGSVRLDGVMLDTARAQLSQSGLRGAQDMIAIRPFIKGRAAALGNQQFGQWLLLGAASLLFAALVIAMFRNFGRRGRTQREAPRMAAPVAQDRGTKTPVSKPVPHATHGKHVSPWGAPVQPDTGFIDQPAPPPLPSTAPAAKADPVPVKPPRVTSSGYRARTAEEIVREVFGPKSGR